LSKYQKQADSALVTIAKFGKGYTISRPRPTFNDITGTLAEDQEEPLTGTIQAVVLPASKGTIEAFDIRLEDLVKGKVKYILAAAKDAPFTPQGLDEITIEGEVFVLKGCTPLAPDGLPIIYKIGAVLK